MAKKSLYEAQADTRAKSKKNVITDMDYYFREKTPEDYAKNTIDMTPPASKGKPKGVE